MVSKSKTSPKLPEPTLEAHPVPPQAPTPRRGYKTCPACQTQVKGPATPKCPKCGHDFGVKKKSKVKTRSTIRTSEIQSELNHRLELLKQAGGLEKVAAEIERAANIQADLSSQLKEIEEQLKPLGGIDGAREIVSLIKTLRAV